MSDRRHGVTGFKSFDMSNCNTAKSLESLDDIANLIGSRKLKTSHGSEIETLQ